MKAMIYRIFIGITMLALLVSLAACGGNGSGAGDNSADPPDVDVTDTGGASSPVSPLVQTDTEPPSTEPPSTEPPSSPEPPSTEPPSTPESPPIQISASEARAILQDWLDGHPIAPPDTLSPEYSERDEGGEAYYVFSLDNMEMYWAYFLVHKETGDLMFMMISDGDEPDIHTEPLGDWYDEYYGSG